MFRSVDWPAWIVLVACLAAYTVTRAAGQPHDVTGRSSGSAADRIRAVRRVAEAGRLHTPRHLLQSQQEAKLDPPAGVSTIKKCLWSDNIGCALNPSFMFTVNATADSYER